MSDVIIVAIITGVFAVIGEIIISARTTKELYAKLDKQSELQDAKLDAKLERYIAKTDAKLESLTEEVRKHNNFAQEIPVMKEQIKTVTHRIEEKERNG
jgi:peptidoglycan hydrolase CwlO-like protein